MTYSMTKPQFEEYRTSVIKATWIKSDKNGSDYYDVVETCSNCHGDGYIKAFSYNANGICFKCNGTGKVSSTVKAMNVDYMAKLEGKRIAKAQEVAERKAISFAESKVKAVETCTSKKGHDCTTCEHRSYCSLVLTAQEALKNVEGTKELSGFDKAILSYNFKEETKGFPKSDIMTLDGEYCKVSRWFRDSFGNLKRRIEKPNGEVVWTTASTEKGLQKLGLKYDEEAREELKKAGII